ncbi:MULTISPECIES: C40 family peptidase [unclassified Apibacter]|uniref:C40 family peptidase n=1 Tax=unclassified Apibacter TaxID=2630820 RepID=UPI001321C0D1|nr:MULTISPECIES: C40 family peptidase [unclassified Apibacter]MCX8676695.1 C40 family peptidase [Apibacter sp. B3919]MXO24921.1 hydrolase Nlp/P60 [Apibacter sp. B3924]MXO26166.1 hydrolase Nlp/P60 [Apibacter sp. B3813]MXO28117.1 hydrolase Nlp/P60 [Apibacter sp. B3913]MXO29523.1 hydrolase Nlp/P60 [Apibacter sp. B3912]
MKSLIKILSVIIVISTSATSCVSNYVASNNDTYKYPTTNEMLVYHPKTVKLYSTVSVSDENYSTTLRKDAALLENSNIYAESRFSTRAYNLLSEARTYLGTPYKYGGTTRRGIDCSSFVQHVFAALNISLPRTSIEQSHRGTFVSKHNLKKGDLIFFAHTPKSRISHVGIVESVSPTGEIFFIHASSSKGVTISSLDTAYWSAKFRTGKRILDSDIDIQKIHEEAQNDTSLAKASV